ncbi:MAG: hypothetical protein ACKVS5_06045, partial [Parvularculaceae bacterium]
MTAADAIAPDLARVAPLRRRMAAIYGVEEDCVLPVRGFIHAIELVLRSLPLAARNLAASAPSPSMVRITNLYGGVVRRDADLSTRAIFKMSPAPFGMALSQGDVCMLLRENPAALVMIDEREIETATKPSLALFATTELSLAVYREVSPIYGAPSSVCGALVGSRALISNLI